ncbi:MAG: flagellar motor switch protein FliG [Gammaproteobacteria bacterium]|nr:flagellar motor switch protein FliG [Gammaproteobacteria bacterium]
MAAAVPTKEKASDLKGPERAAVLMMAVGEEHAAAMLERMGPKEVQLVGEAMASPINITKEMINEVVAEFARTIGTKTSLGSGNEMFLKNVLTKALGEDKASGLLDRILIGRGSKGLEQLKWMEPRAIAEVIRAEHPQIISIILSFLEEDQAAQVLELMPDNSRADILMRIASLDSIQPKALLELDEILAQQFEGSSSSVRSSSVGGHKTAAGILNFMDSNIESEIMEKMKEHDEELGTAIEELMFVFDNLIDVDDRGLQTMMREVSTDSLVLALKGADEALQEKIFKNMSKRAAEMLRDDLEAKGPVRVSEVEEAQKEILAIARRMSEAGEISLGGSGGDEFI